MHILNLVEDDTGWLVDSVESDDSSQDGSNEHDIVVAGWQPEDIIVLDAIRGVRDVVHRLGVGAVAVHLSVGVQALLLSCRDSLLGGLDERDLFGYWNWSIALLYHAHLRRRRGARSISSLRHGEMSRFVVEAWCFVREIT